MALSFGFIDKGVKFAQGKELIQVLTANKSNTLRGKMEKKVVWGWEGGEGNSREQRRREGKEMEGEGGVILLTAEEILESEQALDLAELILSISKHFAKF